MKRTAILTVRIEPDLKTQLIAAADANDRSLASLVAKVLREWIDGEKGKKA